MWKHHFAPVTWCLEFRLFCLCSNMEVKLSSHKLRKGTSTRNSGQHVSPVDLRHPDVHGNLGYRERRPSRDRYLLSPSRVFLPFIFHSLTPFVHVTNSTTHATLPQSQLDPFVDRQPSRCVDQCLSERRDSQSMSPERLQSFKKWG